MRKLLAVLICMTLITSGAVFAAEAVNSAQEKTVLVGIIPIGPEKNEEPVEAAPAAEDVQYEICRHFITFNANPYAFQHVHLKNGDKFNSKYGFGVNAGYRYSFGLFNAGLEIGYNNFNYENYDRYHILSFTAMGGMSYYFTPEFFLDGDLGAGLDIRFMGDENRANVTTLARVNAGYWLTDLIALTGGADLKLSWQNHEVNNLRSTDLGVYVNLGAKISL